MPDIPEQGYTFTWTGEEICGGSASDQQVMGIEAAGHSASTTSTPH